MSEPIYTQKRTAQYSGNYSSTEYNKRIEENYQDLVYLYNKYNIIDSKIDQIFSRLMTDHVFLSNSIQDALDRLKALESSKKIMSLYSYEQIDNARFNGTQYQITPSEQLTFNSIYNYITLPKIVGSCYSVVKMYNSVGDQIVPDFINMRVEPRPSIDAVGAFIDTTPPYYSLYDRYDRVWKRSIVVDSPSENGAIMYFYIKVPTAAVNKKVNSLKLSPYPVNSVDIVSIDYTQKENPTMSSSDGWKPLNSDALYNDDPSAIGSVAPGGWVNNVNSDTIADSGPLYFSFASAQFETKPITGFRITMRQRNYIKENNKYIYTYGLSDLDITVDKYLDFGKAFLKFSAPQDKLIFEVTNVNPKIYNVPLSLIENTFSYKVLYPTSVGGYSEIPQGGSAQVWIEVTLNKLPGDTVPVLSDLIVQYE